MYVERETGGFARGTIIAGDAEKIWDAKAAKTPAEPDPEPAQALEGPSRQDQKHFNEPPAQRVQLPAKIAIETASGAARARSSKTRKLAMLGAVLLAVGATGTFGYRWWTVGRFIEATDDAYVSAHNTTLAAKVAGYVSNIAVEDNSHVRAGDVIATIDDGDFALAVNAARNKVATQQATVERIGRQIVAQQASVEQARAQLVSAQAGATRMRLELDRQQALAQREYASRQTPDAGASAVEPRSRSRRRAKRAGGLGRRRCDRGRPQGAAAGSRENARGAAHRPGQGRARPVLHGDPRAGRWRDRKPGGSNRRFRADRPGASRA